MKITCCGVGTIKSIVGDVIRNHYPELTYIDHGMLDEYVNMILSDSVTLEDLIKVNQEIFKLYAGCDVALFETPSRESSMIDFRKSYVYVGVMSGLGPKRVINIWGPDEESRLKTLKFDLDLISGRNNQKKNTNDNSSGDSILPSGSGEPKP